MAVQAFPSISPTARAWTPGMRPMSAFASLAGYEVRVQHGSIAVGAQLRLSFQNLREEIGKQITDHFAIAQGTYETFELPAAVYAGMSSYDYITPTATTWRYAAPPSVTYEAPGIQSVSVDLAAVPV